MKTSSAKQKGRKLQQTVRDRILEIFPDLTRRDVRSVPMGVSGTDIQLSEKAANIFPFSVECKNQEHINIWGALQQTESDTSERDLTPLLVFKRNFSQVYCTLKFEDFIKIVEKNDKNKQKTA